MKSRLFPIIALALAACSPGKAPAPTDPAFGKAVHDYLVANPEVIEEAQKALAEKKQLALFKIAVADKEDPFIGQKNAKVTVVEFFDYRCPYCEHAVDWVLKQPKVNKDVKVIFKEMPFLTPASVEASQAALAANKQGKYAAMHLALMRSPQLDSAAIDKAARTAGVDIKRMRKDMETVSVIEHLTRVKKLSESAKVESTPTFLVNGVLVAGFDQKALDAAIKKASAN
ncbi:MAG: thioredoxin domain-containing protein [Caulobacterales bacterium]